MIPGAVAGVQQGDRDARRGTQTRQGAPARAVHAKSQNRQNARAAKTGPLMAIMALLRPGGTAQGLGDPDGVDGPMS